MATVPVYGEQRVRSAPLQPVFQNTPDVSSGARALAQGLGQVAEVADRIDLRDAQAKASDAEAKITADWLKWDAENRQKYRGANADGYAPAAEAWWKDNAEAYGKALDPRAKALASRSLSAKQSAALANVLQFQAAEKERHADDTYAADVNTTIQFGVTSGDVAGASRQVREKAAVLGARKGWTTEQVQAEVAKNLSNLHLAQISKLAETDAVAAQKYYEDNKGEVNFANQARVEQILKAEVDNQFATQTAASMAGKPLAEQLAEAAKIADPQRREKTIAQVKLNHAMVKEAERERESAAADQAWQLVGKGQRVPEAVLAMMGGKERVQLQEHLVDRAKKAAEGTPVKTDWAVYVDLHQRLAAGEKVDLRPYAGTKIAGPQMDQLLDLRAKRDDPKKAPEVATSEQQLAAYTREMNLKGERLGQFQSAAYDRFNMHLRTKGKEATYDERQAILAQLTQEVVTGKFLFWDSKAPAYQAPKAVRDKSLPLPTADKFVVGKTYTDKNGTRAVYRGNGQWEPAK